MKHAAAAVLPASGPVLDLIQHRLARALRSRVRYRYVQPCVLHEGSGYRIQSPCCSRNVDPKGGMIDIAWLEQHDGNRWCLWARDHARHTWVACLQDAPLDALLDVLCQDSQRQFWP